MDQDVSEFTFETMDRERSKLSVAVYAPSGAGKTTALLKLAMGIRNELYPDESLAEIGLFIDTERRSSTKSVGRSIGGDVLEGLELYAFEPPFDIKRLLKLIEYAVREKHKKIIIIDSYTAFWSGVDGILENVAEIETNAPPGKLKLYGAWSEKDIITKKNILKNLLTNSQAHIGVGFRAKTEYVVEENDRGKKVPKAIGVKEDMQGDIRYEFDAVLSIDKDTHNVSVEKDRIGYSEYRETLDDPNAPFTVADGEMLAKLISKGMSPEEKKARQIHKMQNFILDEKAHHSSKVALFEKAKSIIIDENYVKLLDYSKLTKLTDFLKG